LGDDGGKPWWEIQNVTLRDIRRACNLMADLFEKTPDKDGEPSMYAGLRTPDDGIDFGDTPRSMEGVQSTNAEQSQTQSQSQGQPPANGVDTGGATERGSEEGELDG
jgi:protein BUR2